MTAKRRVPVRNQRQTANGLDNLARLSVLFRKQEGGATPAVEDLDSSSDADEIEDEVEEVANAKETPADDVESKVMLILLQTFKFGRGAGIPAFDARQNVVSR